MSRAILACPRKLEGPESGPPQLTLLLNRRSPSGRGAADPLGFPAETFSSQAYEVQTEAPDDDLVAVLELVPVHPLAVQEHSIEAAVVQHTHAAVLAMQQSMPPRDRGIVEPDVRREAAPDPGPPFLQGDHSNAVV